MKIHLNGAGLIGISFSIRKRDFCIHFFVKRKEDRIFGFDEQWYDGPFYSFGLGFLLLVCWISNET